MKSIWKTLAVSLIFPKGSPRVKKRMPVTKVMKVATALKYAAHPKRRSNCVKYI
jgi:hypothetical protein